MLPQMERLVGQFREVLDLELTPAGIWELDDNDKKQAIDSYRKDNLSWSDYPNDNMARVFLNHTYLVVDIDGSLDKITDTHFILESGTELPLTAYTVTSSSKKIHAYYKVSDINSLPNRTTSIVEKNVDTFCYGVLFEGHTFKNHSFNVHPVATLPDDHPYLKKLSNLEHTRSSHQTGVLHPVTSPKTKAAITEIYKYYTLEPDMRKKATRQFNKALRLVIPNSYIEKGTPKIIKPELFSYSLINDMAVKLMCVAELGTQDVEQFMRFFVKDIFGYDPDYKGILYKNIMGTLPSRDAIERYNPEEMESMQDLMDKQPGIPAPIFKTAVVGQVSRQAFIQIDRITLEPKSYMGAYLHDKNVAQALSPERSIIDEDGKIRGWDENVPVIENIHCPYSPSLFWSENDWYCVNTYIKTEYQKHTSPRQIDRLETNLIGRFMLSVVPKEHLDYVLRYFAYVCFSDYPPLVTLWMSAKAAGAGKSILTTEIFNVLLGTAATSADAAQVLKAWGNTVKGKRVLAIEDINKSGTQDWSNIYTFIKQQSGNAHRVLDAKYGAITTEKVRISVTGSSNYRILLDPDDRRFFCLEPAHRDPEQPNMPLSEDDANRLGWLMKDKDYSDEVQEFMDHLNYIYQQTITIEQEQELYERAPSTVYKERWKTESKGYTRRVVELVSKPLELDALIREQNYEVVELYKYVLSMWKEDTLTAGLSWKWFATLLPHIKEATQASSKQSVKDTLGIEDWTANIGDRYKLPSNHGLSDEMARWPRSGLILDIDDVAAEQYKQLIIEHTPNSHRGVAELEI